VKRKRAFALGALGVVVPVALAFTAYLVSRTTIGSAGTVPALTHTPAQAQVSESGSSDAGSPSARPTTGRTQGAGGTVAPQPTATVDDHGGRCSEPEHVNDPECQSGGGSGGPGSGGGSGGGGSGDDSSHSGHGSGGDD
jgi:hypothetical protein